MSPFLVLALAKGRPAFSLLVVLLCLLPHVVKKFKKTEVYKYLFKKEFNKITTKVYTFNKNTELKNKSELEEYEREAVGVKVEVKVDHTFADSVAWKCRESKQRALRFALCHACYAIIADR